MITNANREINAQFTTSNDKNHKIAIFFIGPELVLSHQKFYTILLQNQGTLSNVDKSCLE